METNQITKLSKDYFLLTQAQSVGDEIRGAISNFVHEHYDPNNKIASIAAFLTPGILFKTGFRTIAVLVMVAEALGFDLKGFWSEVVNYITSFFKQNGENASLPLNDIISSTFDKHFSGEPDPQQIQALEQHHIFSSREYTLIKQGKVSRSIISKLKDKFVPIVSWVMRAALMSVGFNVAVDVAKHYLGKPSTPSDSQEGSPSSAPKQSPEGEADEYRQYQQQQQIQQKLKYQPTPELTELHKNDMNAVWLLEVDMSNLENELMRWILTAYPALKEQNFSAEVQSSTAFKNIIALFWRRNKLAPGLGILAVPRPFERKIDMVNAVVSSIVSQMSAG